MDVDIGFSALVASRRNWIDLTLKPWCRSASRRDLLAAEQDWLDIAGTADPHKTLWPWAWSRFPVLFVDDYRHSITVTRPTDRAYRYVAHVPLRISSFVL